MGISLNCKASPLSDVIVKSLHSCRRAARRHALLASLFVAWGALSASFFMSHVLAWAPCALCMVQRVAMAAVTILLTAETIIRRTLLPRYANAFTLLALTLSASGALIAACHVLTQRLPPLSALIVHTCSMAVPCSSDPLVAHGFVPVPVLSFLAFAAIVALSIVRLNNR